MTRLDSHLITIPILSVDGARSVLTSFFFFWQIWNVHSVLNVLHSLVDKSNINAQLEMYGKGGKNLFSVKFCLLLSCFDWWCSFH